MLRSSLICAYSRICKLEKALVSLPLSSVTVESISSLRCLLLLKGDTDEAVYFIHMQMTQKNCLVLVRLNCYQDDCKAKIMNGCVKRESGISASLKACDPSCKNKDSRKEVDKKVTYDMWNFPLS